MVIGMGAKKIFIRSLEAPYSVYKLGNSSYPEGGAEVLEAKNLVPFLGELLMEQILTC